MNALHLAVSTDRMDTVRWLVGHGVNLNATDKKLRTPLHYAALRGLRTICEFLVNSGARVTAVDFVGNTPEVSIYVWFDYHWCAISSFSYHEQALAVAEGQTDVVPVLFGFDHETMV